jgi:hypothetical protein
LHGWRRAQPKLCPRTRAPLRPSGGRGRGPTRRVGMGEVGGATNRLVCPPHPTLSPRPAGGEGKRGASSEPRFGGKSSNSRSLHFPRTAFPAPPKSSERRFGGKSSNSRSLHFSPDSPAHRGRGRTKPPRVRAERGPRDGLRAWRVRVEQWISKHELFLPDRGARRKRRFGPQNGIRIWQF